MTVNDEGFSLILIKKVFAISNKVNFAIFSNISQNIETSCFSHLSESS